MTTLITDLIAAREALANEWREKAPHDGESIAAFYRDTVNYDDDLEAWHELPWRKEWTAAIVAAAQVSGAKRVLDVGAGRGHDLQAVLKALPDTLVGAIEPNHKMREHLSEQGIEAWPQLSLLPSHLRDLDLISCVDVLEHVPDPEALLFQMIDRLKMNGLLVEAAGVHDTATPLHLPELRGWDPARVLDRYGFVCRENVGRLRVWQRVSERRNASDTLLLCAWRDVHVETMRSVGELLKLGWRQQTHSNDALISRVRSIAVSKWLREQDGDVFLMIDSDIVFIPQDAQRVVELAREKKGVACGAYPVRGGSHLACRQLIEEGQLPPPISFGPEKPPVEIAYAGTGFFAAHRDVCEAIAATMPLCHANEEYAFWPLFMPSLHPSPHDPTVTEYLSEDWAFCQRATDLGFTVWLETRALPIHLGQAQYDIYTMQGSEPEAPPTDVTGGA